MPEPVVILGLGFTTQRLARRLREREVPVFAAVRNPDRFRRFESLGVRLCPLSAQSLPNGAVLVHSIPPLAEPEESRLHDLLRQIAPRRILYISSTGVYGAQAKVTETTPAAPNDEKGRARLLGENRISGPPTKWSSLILRSAAIYGPGRGIHMRLREGKAPRGAGGVVSRIHVDDLAAILDAGITSQIEGAWPVADDEPAATEEVIEWCARLMGIPVPDALAPRFTVAGRHVDGSRIRTLLHVELQYPSYRTGIPASLAIEAGEPAINE